jgi:uncharacterized protein (DUF362 family)
MKRQIDDSVLQAVANVGGMARYVRLGTRVVIKATLLCG